MSISVIEEVIKDFISSSTPKILAIKGKWGSGKTYTWNRVLNLNKGALKEKEYSYLSLFGISTIQELKTSLALSGIPKELIGESFDIEKTDDYLGKWTWVGLKRLINNVQQIRDSPKWKEVTIPLEVIIQLANKNKIICIDDLERFNSKTISLEDVLGFISNLKEERGCSIVIIFNEEKLEQGAIYNKYREKIIDVEVEFSLNPEEAFCIVFSPEFSFYEEVKKNVIHLGITNIRLLKKIQEIIKTLFNLTEGFHGNVHRQIIHTSIILAFCYFEKEDQKPDIEKINGWNHFLINRFIKNSKIEPWAEMLISYGLSHIDQLDLEICKFIKSGYAKDSGFLSEASKLNEVFRNKDLKDSYFSVWDLFYNSFNENEDQILGHLTTKFESALEIISLSNLDSLVNLFKTFQRESEANQFIEKFFAFHSKEKIIKLYNQEKLLSSFSDPVLLDKIKELTDSTNSLISFEQSIEFLLQNRYLDSDHLSPLLNSTVSDFVNFFKLDHGENHRRIIIRLLDLQNIHSSFENENKEISNKVSEALDRISRESRINQLRVKNLLSSISTR